MSPENYTKFKFHCPKWSFSWTQPYPIIGVFSLAAFVPQSQSWVVEALYDSQSLSYLMYVARYRKDLPTHRCSINICWMNPSLYCYKEFNLGNFKPYNSWTFELNYLLNKQKIPKSLFLGDEGGVNNCFIVSLHLMKIDVEKPGN